MFRCVVLRIALVWAGAMHIPACAVFDAFSGDGDTTGEPAPICVDVKFLGAVDSSGGSFFDVQTCNAVNVADLTPSCGFDGSSRTAILELIVLEPGTYSICISGGVAQRFTVAQGGCSEVPFGICIEMDDCLVAPLGEGPVQIYWEPIEPGECGSLQVDVFTVLDQQAWSRPR